jgi:hypothetical protein
MITEVREHARLIDDHVGALGQPLLGVRHALHARDRRRLFRIGPPECDLVDPVGLAQLRGEHEAGGAASDHEHIDLSGKSLNPLGNRRMSLSIRGSPGAYNR